VLHLTWALTALLAAPNASAAPGARPSVKSVFESQLSLRHFRDMALAPDGARAAWSEKRPDKDGAEILGAIFVADLPSGKPRHLSAAADAKSHREWGAAFSPDGRTIAFLSDVAAPGQLQIWLAPAAGGPARRLTRVQGQLAHLLWSADGGSIAFLFVEGSSQETGALVAYKPDSGVVSASFEEQRIAVADVKTGKVRTISPADLYVYDYDWSPDGRTFVAEAVKGSGTDNYWVAELDSVDAATGLTRSILRPSLQLACPRFSPDGKFVAFIHGIMSDEGSTGGDVWSVAIDGTSSRNLTPNMKWSASALAWRSSGELLFTAHADGAEGIGRVDFSAQTFLPLWTGAESLTDFSLAPKTGVAAAVCSSFERAPEICAGEIGKWKAVTSVNAKARPYWGEARSLHWQSDGTTVQGWLLYPLGFDPARRYPMVVDVHGGPSSAQRTSWPERWTAILPSQGYFVFLPNPRGSYGFGEAFVQGNVKDFGGGDLRDILSGVDAAVKSAPVDPARVGIGGWSYGGYMAMWAVTQTHRFAAAVAGAGIASWQSYYGQNRIDTWMLPFFGASVYDDPKVYAKSSPIEFIKNAKTPTLVLHGDRDSEVPTPQGYEFWHALKALGVPTQLVIYTGEGHGIRQAAHQVDILERVVGWYDRYLGAH
jgi:dipeptidyl aminopeptidase/acylaminoacyl peptidase